MTTQAPTDDDDDLPLWRRYELTVHELLSALDPASAVSHNTYVKGKLSRAYRQLDIWAVGRVIGIEVTIAVECKRLARFVSVDLVDQFIGKLIDVGADKGIMYSYSGFTSSAVVRALSATNPTVMTVALDTPDFVKQDRGVPGPPPDLDVQQFPPQWIEELPRDCYEEFLVDGYWPKYREAY